MVRINENYTKLPGSYLFSEVGRRARAYQAAHADAKLIRLGIGDVTRPLPDVCVAALKRAADEMGTSEGFRGYAPEQGYDFLQQAISEHEYRAISAPVAPDEVFVSDGAKSDTANFQELFAEDCVVAVPDPVYPVYVDSNALAGRAGEYVDGRWSRLVYLPCLAENGFLPALPNRRVDIIYLCFPNNPTGAVLDGAQLKAWVDYARAEGAIILYDAAYRRYITRPGIPRSIYEVEGAREVAVEFGSFSKSAGFTGLRCSWTVVPKELFAADGAGRRQSLHAMWMRRHTTKFNGTPYVVQRAAEAIYTREGAQQVDALVRYYMENARLIRETLTGMGLVTSGGVDAPYIWFQCPGGMDSWRFFDFLLDRAHVIGTPGAGFGPSGEGCFRLTAFGDREQTRAACERIRRCVARDL